MKAPALVRIHGGIGPSVLHYDGPNGPLCSWDGGTKRDYLGATGATECRECFEIVSYLWKLWHPRSACPARYQRRLEVEPWPE